MNAAFALRPLLFFAAFFFAAFFAIWSPWRGISAVVAAACPAPSARLRAHQAPERCAPRPTQHRTKLHICTCFLEGKRRFSLWRRTSPVNRDLEGPWAYNESHMIRKILKAVLVLVVILVVTAGVLYAFGARIIVDGGGGLHVQFVKSADEQA